MYAGQMVEAGRKREVLGAPCHPYTAALLACHPDRMESLAGIPGAVPSPLSPPSGCRFHPRCAVAEPGCAQRPAGLTRQGDGRSVGCIRFDGATVRAA
jgi:oligopeptide/dipeptide ABC transporter ATP-binding protein